ncbi:MAG: hypothetical protein HY922_13305 [Elusimicrobia bacterium]|nr:hypothetical protein [Elusimicrobiota bacterium]
MTLALKKLLACLLAASLVWTAGAPVSAWAGESKAPVAAAPDPAQALAFLKQKGVIKSEKDPLLSYVFDAKTGKLTRIGETLYRYFMADEQQIGEYQETFEDIRKLGAYTDKKREAVEKAYKDVTDRFGSVAGADAEDAFMLGAKLNALLTGVMQAEQPKQDFMQVDTDQDFVFVDRRGVAVRMMKSMSCRSRRWPAGYEPLKMSMAKFPTFKAEKEASGDWEDWECAETGGVVTYNRDLVRQQQKMNKGRPPCAPKIPETGRYNYEMLYYSYCQRQEQVDQIEKGERIDRMARLAQLLGKQYREDQFIKDKTLEADLAAMGRKKKINEYDGVCGRVVSDYTDLVDCRLEKRNAYLDKAKKHLLSYRRRVESFKGRDVILPEEISGMQADEQIIFKYVVLTFLETQRFHTVNQLESLGFEVSVENGALVLRRLKKAPEAEALRKALKDSPLSEAEKADYKKAADILGKRLQQLMAIFRKLEGEALDADHVTGMGLISSALQSTQKQLGDVGLDYMIYSAMPQLAKITKDEDRGVTPLLTRGGAKLVNKLSKLWKGDAAGGYLQNRETLGKFRPQLLSIARMISRGDFKAARTAIIAMDPDAVDAYGSITLGGDNKITDPQRIQASLRKTQETLQSVAKVHVWTGIVINTLAWSAALAIAAPVASAALTGVAKMAFTAAKAVQGIAYIGRPLAFGLRAAGAIAEHTALRLSSLSPAADKLYSATRTLRVMEGGMVRFVNASARMGSFALLLSGPISGAMAAGTHMYEQKIGKGHSAFATAGEAFVLGYQQGAKWATDSWHPMLLYAGIPSSVYEGTFMAPVADSLATRGLVGNASALAESGLSRFGATSGAARWLGSHGIEGLAKAGGWQSAAATFLSMGDNIAKYYALSYGSGAAAQWASYRFNTIDGSNIERRILRAQQAGMAAMELPLWLALPVYPAKYEAHAQAQQRSKQGYEEYKKAGELDKIANAAADTAELPLKHDPQTPISQRIFNLRWRGESGEHGNFKVDKNMKYQAIQEVLPGAIKGAGRGEKVDPLSVNPLEYYKVSQMNDNQMVGGKLYVNDEVRDQAQGLFEKSIVKNTKLAGSILDAKPGSKIDGFGTVQLRHQEEVARILYRAQQDGAASVPKGQYEASLRILKPYLESEQLVAGKAKALVEALGKNPTPSKTFTQTVEEMMQRTVQWKNNQDTPHADASKSYVDLFTEFRSKIEAKKAQLSAAETTVLGKTLDYLEAIQQRFQYFNRQETFVSRVKTSLEALKTEYTGASSPNQTVQRTLDGMLRRTLDWAAQNRSAGEAILKPGESPKAAKPGDFGGLLLELKKTIDAQKPNLAASDLAVLDGAYKEIQAAPWMLQDSKGTNLQGWRPVQFEGLMYFLYSVTRSGAQSSEIVRTFLQMKTGAGKTLIAFEGLLPFADADATLRGKKTMFLTVQSNLESQARMEFRSLKKLATKMTLDTWEGFKTKIAEGKLKFHNTTDDYWILGDEMDGAALQPALTIGETTASISKEGSGYRMLKSLGKRMENLFNKAPQEARTSVESQVRRMQATAESMPEGPARAAMLQNAKDLLQASRSLALQESKAFTPSDNKGVALERARGWLNRQGAQKLSQADAEALSKLVSELKAAPGEAASVVEKLDMKLRELHNSAVQYDVMKAEQRIQNIVGKQTNLVSEMPQAQSVKLEIEAAGKDLMKALTERKSIPLADRQAMIRQVEGLLLDQKSVLLQAQPSGDALAKNLRRMAAQARGKGNAELAREYEAQAFKLSEGAAKARVELKANAEGLRQAVKEGTPGWELKARELLAKREVLVDKAVARENPIYEIFSKMRQDMYSMVRSTVRTQDDALVVSGSPKQAALRLETAGKDLVERVQKLAQSDPKAEPYVEAAKQLQTRWNQQAAKLRTMLDAPVNAEHQALLAARLSAHEGLAKAETQLKTARADFDAAEPTQKVAMREKLGSAQVQVDLWNGKISDLNHSISRFDLPRKQAVVAQLETLLADSRQTAAAWKTNLSAFKGPEADMVRLSVEPMPAAFQSEIKRLEITADKAAQIWQRRIDGVGSSELALRYGLRWTGLSWALSKVPGLSEARVLQPITPTTKGLARVYAGDLAKQFLNDPFLPPDVKWRMFWEIAPSAIWPRGPTGQSSGWVRAELFNLARGYLDNPANIRVDNITGRINIIHNGQWFESMDTPTRRYWELEYGTDLTLPYEHKTIVTMNDLIRDNHNFRFVGFSGTTGKEFYSYMSGNKVDIVGKGSAGAPNTTLELHSGPSGKFTTVGETVRAADGESLVVLSVSDTKMVKAVRQYLLKTGLLEPENIAMVFSDAELMRLNRPQAQVGRQMNLDGLTTGKVKVLILDTRVGGRGLDLNFKGERGKPGGFGGYKKFEMLILDPQEMSGVHNIQSQGRIDLGRVLPGVTRNFKLVMDVQTAQKDPVFQRMMADEPIMRQLAESPEAQVITLRQGKLLADWAVLHTYVQELEAGRRSPGLTDAYHKTVEKYLTMRQDVVEQEQLRAASVLRDAPKLSNPLFRGLEGR